MKPLLGYLFLANGIIFGIASNSFAKISDGFTKLTPSVICILFMCITMFSIAKAMSALPVGFAYSTYSGLTVTGVVLFAVLKFNQIPNIYGIIGIIFIRPVRTCIFKYHYIAYFKINEFKFTFFFYT